MCVCVLTSLRRPECEHLVGLVQLVEALGQNLHLVAAVWLQETEPGAALVAVGVHDGPLLDPHQPDTHTHTHRVSNHELQFSSLVPREMEDSRPT